MTKMMIKFIKVKIIEFKMYRLRKQYNDFEITSVEYKVKFEILNKELEKIS